MPSLARTRLARVAPLLAALLALAATDAATAAAQGGTTPATIAACYVPASGTIYRINTPAAPAPGAPTKCLSPTHVQFSWSAGPGPSDFEEVTNAITTTPDAGGRRSVSAVCPAGKIAVGGNYSIFANGGNYGWGIVPVSSGTLSTSTVPTDPPNAYFVLTADAPGYGGPAFIRVVVKCAKVS